MNLKNLRLALLNAPATLGNVARLSRRLRLAVQNPWSLAWQLLRSQTCICTAILPSGDQFLLRNTVGDMYVLMEIFGHSTYASLFKELKGGYGQVVDVGANIGAFTLSMARRADTILAIEPEPSNADILRNNIRLNKLNSRVIVEQAAVGSTDTKGRLRLGPNSLLHSVEGNDFVDYESNRHLDISILSLKSLFEKHKIESIDLMKIDCEGYEYDIIYGCDMEIFGRIRSMIIELHRCSGHDDEPDRMIRYLQSFGFRTVFKPEACNLGMGYGIGLLAVTR